MTNKPHQVSWLQEFFIFEEGVVVFWGMEKHEIKGVISNMKEYSNKKYNSDIISEATESELYYIQR